MDIKNKIFLSLVTASLVTLSTGCSSDSDGDTPPPPAPAVAVNCTSVTYTTPTSADLSGSITSHTLLTQAGSPWTLNGLVAVTDETCLKIEAGTTILGASGTGTSTSYLVIDKNSKILAEGTSGSPIIFTSKLSHDGTAAAVGQWGGLTLIGNAANSQVEPYEVNSNFVAGTHNKNDSSGILKYVKILNSGITMEENKEINGLSMVGVGRGTVVDHITVNKSDDDCMELWGGTVNLSNITLSECTDDHFDIDDGYSGIVSDLTINQTTGNAGIEMSGNTAATFNTFNINVTTSAKEGAIYFKKDGIGGHFNNGTIVYGASTLGNGVIHSKDGFDAANTSFANMNITDNSGVATTVTGDSATGIQTKLTNQAAFAKVDLAGKIVTDTTLTSDVVWVLNGLVAVEDGATLTIEAGTTVAGASGTGTSTSYMVVDKGSKIMAEGTNGAHIVFTSEAAVDGTPAAAGQWGGLTLIGNAANSQVDPYEVNSNYVAGTSDLADNSGTLTYIEILNSGITMEENKEINGLSMVGVGSGTTVNNIIVNKSDDDCIELWGGTVDLTDVTLSECSDDHFDIDDGYAGTVDLLTINQTTGNAGIEMSGNTSATFTNFDLNINASAKEGAIYFKKDGIGGHFNTGTITYNVSNTYGAIYSKATFDSGSTSFDNVAIDGDTNASTFTGDSAADLLTAFTSGSANTDSTPNN